MLQYFGIKPLICFTHNIIKPVNKVLNCATNISMSSSFVYKYNPRYFHFCITSFLTLIYRQLVVKFFGRSDIFFGMLPFQNTIKMLTEIYTLPDLYQQAEGFFLESAIILFTLDKVSDLYFSPYFNMCLKM